jgi:hypothetical protein
MVSKPYLLGLIIWGGELRREKEERRRRISILRSL